LGYFHPSDISIDLLPSGEEAAEDCIRISRIPSAVCRMLSSDLMVGTATAV